MSTLLFENIKVSTFLDDSLFRRSLTICSAFENILSKGIEVSGGLWRHHCQWN